MAKLSKRVPEILRIAQITFGLLTIILIASRFGFGPFKGILYGQTYVILFTGITVVISSTLLAFQFINRRSEHFANLPWIEMDTYFNVIAGILLVFVGFLEAYYATGAWWNRCSWLGSDGYLHNPCRTIAQWAFASLFLFVMSITHFASAYVANHNRDVDF